MQIQAEQGDVIGGITQNIERSALVPVQSAAAGQHLTSSRIISKIILSFHEH